MAKNYVYLVHGLGKHSNTWIDDDEKGNSLRKQIEAAWKQYPELGGKFSEQFELVSVHYDDVYSTLYTNWSEQVKTLKVHLAANPLVGDKLDFLIGLAEKPAQGDADDKFFYTHILDLLWYWGNSLVQGKIISEVADQIFEHLKKHYDEEGVTFSIVAHSMGTSVIHKVLQSLYTDGKYKNILSGYLKFKVLMQVSNTSYVLSANRDKHYTTLVKPSFRADEGVCWYMINVAHRYDLVAELIPFKPDVEEWLDSDTIANKDLAYQDIQTQRMASPDVHSIIRYFENPAVHGAFFKAVTDKEIKKESSDKAWKAFIDKTPDIALKNVRLQFENMLKNHGESMADFIKSVKLFAELIATFKI